MSDAFQKIRDLQEQLKKTIREEGGKILEGELKKFMVENPEIDTLLWAQSDNVYNDETYEFQVFGFDVLPNKDVPWYDVYMEEVADMMGWDKDEVLNRVHFHGESAYMLGRDGFLSKVAPEHRERLKQIQTSLRAVQRSVPKEVLEHFGNVSAKVTKDGLHMEDYENDY
jgi:hypothetical protein